MLTATRLGLSGLLGASRDKVRKDTWTDAGHREKLKAALDIIPCQRWPPVFDKKLLDASLHQTPHCCRCGARGRRAAGCRIGVGRRRFFFHVPVSADIHGSRDQGFCVPDFYEHGHDILDSFGRLRTRLPKSGQQRDLAGIFGSLAIDGGGRFARDVQFQSNCSVHARNLQLPMAVAAWNDAFRSHVDQGSGQGCRAADRLDHESNTETGRRVRQRLGLVSPTPNFTSCAPATRVAQSTKKFGAMRRPQDGHLPMPQLPGRAGVRISSENGKPVHSTALLLPHAAPSAAVDAPPIRILSTECTTLIQDACFTHSSR